MQALPCLLNSEGDCRFASKEDGNENFGQEDWRREYKGKRILRSEWQKLLSHPSFFFFFANWWLIG